MMPGRLRPHGLFRYLVLDALPKVILMGINERDNYSSPVTSPGFWALL